MPGLVGIVSTNDDKVNLNLMKAMHTAIQHQDWYRTDTYVNSSGTAAISRVHLGIINKDQQPYAARSGRVQLFLHGQIYNDTATDANPLDFIYHLYEKKGLDFASDLNGSFVIVIVDNDKDVVLIANDRIASQPLFYFNDNQAIYFGPEMKSLLLVASLERKLDLAAVTDFLTNGHFTREHTLIKGLARMNNATVLKVTKDEVTQHKYWEYDLEREVQDRGFKYYQSTLAELLRQAVQRHIRTDNTYGILLSGGYDSRGILGCYLEAKDDRELHTISWGWEEEIPNSDCVVARRLAQKLNANHQFYKRPVEEVVESFRDFVLLGEGLTDEVASYDVFHRIRQQQRIDIILRGDESFGVSPKGGYLVHDEHTMFRRLGLKAIQNIQIYKKVLKPSYYQLFCELDAETIRHVSARCKAKNLHNRKDFYHLDIRLRYWLNPLNYIKTFALESFTPWLDYDILDFVSALPIKYRLGKSLYRKTVVEMFPELFEEFAQVGNEIVWRDALKSFPELERLVYRELIEEQSLLGEFIDIDSLKSQLDAFFATSNSIESPGFKARVKTNLLRLLAASPATYDLFHRSAYYSRKWRGQTSDSLPAERLIMRLLILKIWGDIFLRYPVVNTS